MSVQSHLRTHDLPPKWDGHVVQWCGWEYVAPAFICPPPRKEVCEGCGMPTTLSGFPCWSTARGIVALSTRTTLNDLRAEDEIRRRAGWAAGQRKPLALHRLIAFRCHHCGLDTVWDTDADHMWNLDDSDYGDEGSST